MELQEQDIVLLEAYLDGSLQGEARARLEARLQSEPAMAEMLAMMRSLEPASKQGAHGQLRKEMKAAKVAAIAAGLATYTPSINTPTTGNDTLWRLLKSLLKLAIAGAIGYAAWKYLIQPRMQENLGDLGPIIHQDTKTTTTTKRDTIRDTMGEWRPGMQVVPNHSKAE